MLGGGDRTGKSPSSCLCTWLHGGWQTLPGRQSRVPAGAQPLSWPVALTNHTQDPGDPSRPLLHRLFPRGTWKMSWTPPSPRLHCNQIPNFPSSTEPLQRLTASCFVFLRIALGTARRRCGQGKNSSSPFSEERTAERGRPPSGLGTQYRRRSAAAKEKDTPTPRPGLWLGTSGKGSRPRPHGVRPRRREDRLGRAQSAAHSPAAPPPRVNRLLARIDLRSGRRDPSPQTRRTCARRRTAGQLSVKATRETRTVGAAALSALLGRRSAGMYHHGGRG
ncbi:uncharacterized protein LOC127693960 [Apodemus sylvaticus]|uniref:uncharacterized protein LOC127693960 n=1 Tax=Apodemus sylvaticus TaxID=10129 RepID=UPI0022418B80|nr:uncharacterized protein LOC127693960 [Apodemus sylvaticus]